MPVIAHPGLIRGSGVGNGKLKIVRSATSHAGGGAGHRIQTHGDLVAAFKAALPDKGHLHVLNVLLDPADRSPAMMRLAHRLGKRVAVAPHQG